MPAKELSIKKSIIIAIGLFVIGLFIQLVAGSINISSIAFPLNLIIAIQFVIIIVALYVFIKKSSVVAWLSSAHAALTSIFCLGIAVILMAAIPQHPSKSSLITSFGLNNIVFSWYFALSLVFLLTVLALVTIRRLSPVNRKNIFFFINHFGLFLAVLAGILGQADKKQLYMPVYLNQTIWYAENDKNETSELPFALHLNQFVLKHHPSKIAFISLQGELLELKGNAAHGADESKDFYIGNYLITVNKFIENAIIDSDSTYKQANHQGATQIAIVNVVKPDGETIKGSVVAGSYFYNARYLKLSNDTIIALLPPEPAYFGSEILLYTKSGITAQPNTISVNQPLKAEGWNIYQHSYDSSKGKDSEYSVFYLVYDPWLPVVYTGIFLMLAGALLLMLFKVKTNNDKRI